MGGHPTDGHTSQTTGGDRTHPAARQKQDHTWRVEGAKAGPLTDSHVATRRKDFRRVQENIPPRTQHLFTIPKKREPSPTTGTTHLTPPPKATNHSKNIQDACLELTSCLQCSKLCSLSKDPTKSDYGVTCNHCDLLSRPSLALIRQRQVDIIQSTFTSDTTARAENNDLNTATNNQD